MTEQFFTDKKHRPTEEEILAAVGRTAGAWCSLFDRIGKEHPSFSKEWRYFADGNSWLLKVANKSKTMCWVSVQTGGFRVAFYFPERVVGALLASELSQERKMELREGEPTGKLRGVRVAFGPQRGVRDVMTLIALKTTLK